MLIRWLLIVGTVLGLVFTGCKKKDAPPPAPPTADQPCGWESLMAWRPTTGIVASRERLPESTTEEVVDVMKEARPNCGPDEAQTACRARILKMARTWVEADVTLELEPYEEPNARKWRLDTLEPAGTTTLVGGKELPNMNTVRGTELFDTSDACMEQGRTTRLSGRYSCSPAAHFGFTFRGTRKRTVTTQHGRRLRLLWLYPKDSDPPAALAELTLDLERSGFKLNQTQLSNPGGYELELTCPKPGSD